jgi:hypothetical protein
LVSSILILVNGAMTIQARDIVDCMCLNQGRNCTNPLVAKDGATMPKGLEEILGCQIGAKLHQWHQSYSIWDFAIMIFKELHELPIDKQKMIDKN